MNTFTTYNGSLRFDLFCGVSCINTVSRPALHCTDTVSPNCCCKVLISLVTWSQRPMLITVDPCRQCVVNCMLHGCGCVLAPAPAPSEQNMTASEEPHSPATRPRTAALAAAERNPVRGFPVKLLLCRLPARARNEPSRGFHNYR